VFDDFANVWTVVGLADELRPNKALPLLIAGERVVLFRDSDGAPVGLIDRCPHRGVALSLGCVERGEIQCPFHGWRFGRDGANRRIPWNPNASCENYSAIALNVRQRDGLLWLRTGANVVAEQPPPIQSLARGGLRLCAQSFVWRAHWTRVMENMLDSPHVPFVHRRTFGGQVACVLDADPEAQMNVRFEPHEHGGKIHAAVYGEERAAALDYRFPNLMELTLDSGRRIFRIFAVCIPLSDRETRLQLITARSFLRAKLFDPLFVWANKRIAEEDRAIVESSLPCCSPSLELEKSVPTDAGTLAFRRLYRQKLVGTRA
jgi:phenylpropionate dioxygenase-like ring-hydroxylating dioxygenase large terminal subunit